MRIDVNRLLGLGVGPRSHHLSRRDARLYALGVGFGADPLDETDLEFVVERPDLKVVPTMATIFADVILELSLACKLERPELAVHAEQHLEMLAPLATDSSFDVSGSITAIYDRGSDRGAEIHMQAEARLSGSGDPLFRANYVTVARGDGGFDGPPPPHAERPALPDTAPAHSIETRVAANQALLYALNGDPNPIHTEPRLARRAGFDRPLLHGLCTYGMACRALLRSVCDGEPQRIAGFDARFAAPVFPGDTLRFDIWHSHEKVQFAAHALERDVAVLRNGVCRLQTKD